jgi:iron complex transport system permease protein
MSEKNFQYKAYVWKKITLLTAGIIICIVSFTADVMVGSSNLSLSAVFTSIFNSSNADKLTNVIIWKLRLPTAVMGILVGAALGLSGAVMQTILNNPLASPYTLGISAGAGVGASIALLTGMGSLAVLGSFLVPLSAFVFAFAACLGIYLISRIKRFTSETMVLTGIGMVFFFQAVQSFLQYLASPEALQSIVFWTFGSLEKSNWTNIVIIAAVFFIVFFIVYQHVWMLTAMKLGDEKAKVLGIDVEHLRMVMFLMISLLTATAVAFVGSIGFIGIVGPHIARILLGEDQRYYLPMSSICGAAILSLASVATKLVVPGAVFPIGILTSMIGVPFFFILIIKKKR